MKKLFCLIIFIFAIYLSASGQDSEWTWRLGTDQDDVKRTRYELDTLLKLHKKWIESSKRKGKLLILNNASLQGADLRSADLRGADLSGADLSGADLTRANLTRTRLINANLSIANLTSANLENA